jgi:hypothetical protein
MTVYIAGMRRSGARTVTRLPNLRDKIDPVSVRDVFPHLLHVHYHWLFAEGALPANPPFLPYWHLSGDRRDWLSSAALIVK